MIRHATTADADAIVALERALFEVDAWTEDQVVAELAGVGREAWVCTSADPGEVTGYVITRLVDEVADLLRIGVHPALRREGLASALLAQALEGPADRMLLEVAESNVAARAFYARHGFVEIDRRGRYFRDGTDALVLMRSL